VENREVKTLSCPSPQCGKNSETVTSVVGPRQIVPRLYLLLTMTVHILHGHRTIITTVVVSAGNLYQFVSGSHYTLMCGVIVRSKFSDKQEDATPSKHSYPSANL
jgi:hypothetical protein